MAKKSKPNFTPFGNKKPKKQRSVWDGLLGPAPSKKHNSRKTHHDSLKGGGGNNGGKRR